MVYAVSMNIREAQIISYEVVKALFNKLDSMGVSCYAISQRCNISEAALSYIKHGNRQPRLCILLMIADACDISLAEIIRNVEKKFPADTKKDSK